MKLARRTHGFTFIELIIAIVIIGILSVMGIGSYTNSLKTSRDARRRVDLDSIRSALELYKSNDINSSYPGALTALETPTKFITLPFDPKTKLGYSYSPAPLGCDGSTSYCTTYTISATLEGKTTLYQLDPFGEVKSQ